MNLKVLIRTSGYKLVSTDEKFSKPLDNLEMPRMHLSWYFYVQYILRNKILFYYQCRLVLCSWPKPL